jgi:hypothetical protein
MSLLSLEVEAIDTSATKGDPEVEAIKASALDFLEVVILLDFPFLILMDHPFMVVFLETLAHHFQTQHLYLQDQLTLLAIPPKHITKPRFSFCYVSETFIVCSLYGIFKAIRLSSEEVLWEILIFKSSIRCKSDRRGLGSCIHCSWITWLKLLLQPFKELRFKKFFVSVINKAGITGHVD